MLIEVVCNPWPTLMSQLFLASHSILCRKFLHVGTSLLHSTHNKHYLPRLYLAWVSYTFPSSLPSGMNSSTVRAKGGGGVRVSWKGFQWLCQDDVSVFNFVVWEIKHCDFDLSPLLSHLLFSPSHTPPFLSSLHPSPSSLYLYPLALFSTPSIHWVHC